MQHDVSGFINACTLRNNEADALDHQLHHPTAILLAISNGEQILKITEMHTNPSSNLDQFIKEEKLQWVPVSHKKTSTLYRQ